MRAQVSIRANTRPDTSVTTRYRSPAARKKVKYDRVLLAACRDQICVRLAERQEPAAGRP